MNVELPIYISAVALASTFVAGSIIKQAMSERLLSEDNINAVFSPILIAAMTLFVVGLPHLSIIPTALLLTLCGGLLGASVPARFSAPVSILTGLVALPFAFSTSLVGLAIFVVLSSMTGGMTSINFNRTKAVEVMS